MEKHLIKSKILLIEDDEMIARMYQERFSRNGFEIILAFSGEEGLEKAEKEKPDIILLDIMLPKMNGYEVLKALKGKETTVSIPVIILSSLGALPELVEKSKALGVADVITKGDVPAKEVVLRVKSILEKK